MHRAGFPRTLGTVKGNLVYSLLGGRLTLSTLMRPRKGRQHPSAPPTSRGVRPPPQPRVPTRHELTGRGTELMEPSPLSSRFGRPVGLENKGKKLLEEPNHIIGESHIHGNQTQLCTWTWGPRRRARSLVSGKRFNVFGPWFLPCEMKGLHRMAGALAVLCVILLPPPKDTGQRGLSKAAVSLVQEPQDICQLYLNKNK